MSEDATLRLSFRPEARLPDMRKRDSWRGFSVEYSRIIGASEFSFSFSGTRQYLCLHDLLLSDGKVVADGLRPIQRRDLRNNLTFLPRGCSVAGFAAPVDRTNSFTALSFSARRSPSRRSGRTGRPTALPWSISTTGVCVRHSRRCAPS